MRLSGVRYKYDIKCGSCGSVIAREGRLSAVVDEYGEVMDAGYGSADFIGHYYELTCPSCDNATISLRSRDLEELSCPDDQTWSGPNLRFIS